jgi:hypothetical protein
MDTRNGQFLSLYYVYRHKDQDSFYRARHAEFDRARRQAVIIIGVLMFLTATVSILAAAELILPKWVWAVLGVSLPALSTAFTAYNSLFAFEQQSKLYQDASRALQRAEADAHGLQQAATRADRPDNHEAYVNEVEEVLRKEHCQWGQLTSEIELSKPPKRAEK